MLIVSMYETQYWPDGQLTSVSVFQYSVLCRYGWKHALTKLQFLRDDVLFDYKRLFD